MQSPMFAPTPPPELPHGQVIGIETTVRVINGIDALSALAPAWDKLLAAVPSSTIFSSWEWLSAWWHAFGTSKKLAAVALFDHADRLVGIAPLAFEKRGVAGLAVRVVRLMGDGSGDSDNLDLLALPGYEKRLVVAVMDYLLEHRADWDYAQFNTFSDESALREHLVDELRRREWTVLCRQRPGIVIDLPEDWNSYLKRLCSKRRWQIKHILHRLEAVGEHRIFKAEGAQLPSELDAFFVLHERRWREQGLRGAFACRERREFYKEMAQLFAARGWLQFWILEAHGLRISADFDFRYRDTVYRLQCAFDPAYAANTPGHLLMVQLLQQWTTTGVRRYDFLAGDEQYKKDWGGRTRSYHDIHFAIPRTRGSISLRIVSGIAAVRARVRSHLPPGLLRAARRLRQWCQLWTGATAP